jgi:AraC-like DNA-binding protein
MRAATSATYALESTWRPLLKDMGVSPANVLRRACLPEDLLTRGEVRLEAADFHRFWAGLEAELGDPLFPLRVCQAVRSETFSPALFAALCSPSFLVAVQRIARYKALVAPMQLWVWEDAGHAVLDLDWPDPRHPPPPSLAITELLFFVGLARMGTREMIRPLRVTTPTPPSPAAAYARFLGVEISRGNRHQIAFAREDARRPFLTTNEGLWAAFEPELRTRLAELAAGVTVGQRVRAALLEALPSGQGDMDAVSAKLAISRRTLQRHLAAEGLRYSALLQETRQALAQHYLIKTELPAAEIAFLLGFEEPNSFYRAFRAWTRQTPEAARRQARSNARSTPSILRRPP